MAQVEHLANVFELQCHAFYMMETDMPEPDAKVSASMISDAVKFIVNTDADDDVHERYERIFEDMCEELGLEID